MKALQLNHICDLTKERNPLVLRDIPIPKPDRDEVLIRNLTCGICHTELDEIEGRTPPPFFPVIPGHQVVGIVEELGEAVTLLKPGDRVGVAWISDSCGRCKHCLEGNENLCHQFKATGRDVNGGYAEYMTVKASFAFKMPERSTDAQAAPLLCAGAIGYRSLRLTGLKNGSSLGLTGFGASAHLVLKLSKYMYPDSDIYVFARSEKERAFALELGAAWSGDTESLSPVELDAIIDTTPVWKPIVYALKSLAPGGRLVINAIRKEDVDKDYLLKMNYHDYLWMEREIKSVANVAKRDVVELLEIASEIPIIPEVQEYPLRSANDALMELKEGKIRGAKVLRISGG